MQSQNLTMKLGETQNVRLNERSRTTWAFKLTSKGSPGGKAENQVGTSKPESAENHRVQIKRLETERADFAQN